MSSLENNEMSVVAPIVLHFTARVLYPNIIKGMYNGSILAVPRRINAEVEEREARKRHCLFLFKR